jgi:hypothetical protein
MAQRAAGPVASARICLARVSTPLPEPEPEPSKPSTPLIVSVRVCGRVCVSCTALRMQCRAMGVLTEPKGSAKLSRDEIEMQQHSWCHATALGSAVMAKGKKGAQGKKGGGPKKKGGR